MSSSPSAKNERVVTVHLAVECIIEGDAPTDLIAQTVTSLIDIPQMAVRQTVITPRAVGLIRHDEKFVEPQHNQVAT